jgi:putative two-component system response regulator
MLRQEGYRVRPVLSGRLALEAAKNEPPDLILLDIAMPEMDGYEVCRRLKADQALCDVPVIFISAMSETIDKIRAFSLGGVDYVTKPFQFEEVIARVRAHLKIHRLQSEVEAYNTRLEELVQLQVKEILESQMATIFSIAKLAESRDDDAGRHLERVQIICRSLAQNLASNPRFAPVVTRSFIENISHASPLHDIGKVAIPDRILLKPGKLTPDEFEIMKTHTLLGARTLSEVRRRYQKNYFLEMGIEIAQYHHEKWDGSGYNEGLSGVEIPLSARIMAVADVYDATRSKRIYKEAFPHEKSREIIAGGSGAHFDPDVVAAFEQNQEKISAMYNGLYMEM